MTTTFRSAYADGAHNVSFGRSLAAELHKLRLRSIIGASLAMLVFYVGLMTLIISTTPTAEITNPKWISGGWSLLPMFAVVIGTLVVTSEYSANTMRTTTLAEPQRLRGVAAKAAAVTILVTALMLALVTISTIVLYVSSSSISWTTEDLSTLGAFIAVIVIIALMALGLGYVFRSKAATITMLFAVFYLGDLVTMIDKPFFQETMPKFLPYQLAVAAIENSDVAYYSYPLIDSRGGAIAILGLYALLILVAGALVYRRRDV